MYVYLKKICCQVGLLTIVERDNVYTNYNRCTSGPMLFILTMKARIFDNISLNIYLISKESLPLSPQLSLLKTIDTRRLCLFVARSALSLALQALNGTPQSEVTPHFFVRAAGVHRFIRRYHVKNYDMRTITTLNS